MHSPRTSIVLQCGDYPLPFVWCWCQQWQWLMQASAEHAQVIVALRMRTILGKGQSGIESHFKVLYNWLKWPKKALASYVCFYHSHRVYMVLVIFAGFVSMRVISLKHLNVLMKHLRGRHEKRSTSVVGLIGGSVTKQCTSECCEVCLCLWGWAWGYT